MAQLKNHQHSGTTLKEKNLTKKEFSCPIATCHEAAEGRYAPQNPHGTVEVLREDWGSVLRELTEGLTELVDLAGGDGKAQE